MPILLLSSVDGDASLGSVRGLAEGDDMSVDPVLPLIDGDDESIDGLGLTGVSLSLIDVDDEVSLELALPLIDGDDESFDVLGLTGVPLSLMDGEELSLVLGLACGDELSLGELALGLPYVLLPWLVSVVVFPCAATSPGVAPSAISESPATTA